MLLKWTPNAREHMPISGLKCAQIDALKVGLKCAPINASKVGTRPMSTGAILVGFERTMQADVAGVDRKKMLALQTARR
jgi:hypothetical protein